MEYIPSRYGELKLYAIVNDLMVVASRRGISLWFWIDDIAVDITSFVKGREVVLGETRIDLDEVFDDKPWFFGYIFDSVDIYTEFLARYVTNVLRDRRVLLAYSGGKDSTAALLVLDKLRNHIPYRLDVMYVHIPFIEPLDNIRFVDYVSKNLGISIAIVEPIKNEVLNELYNRGLPVRGARLCTYIKVAPLRVYAKARGIDYIAYGDRVWEAGKRFERLFYRTLVKKVFASRKRGFTVVAPLTLLDVVEICKSYGLIHPHYLLGIQRVACRYCPYKPVYEFYGVKVEVEDEGLIEEFAKCGWKRFYLDHGIDFESYWRYHLWRFPPGLARALARAKVFAEKLIDRGYSIMKANEVLRDLGYMWMNRVEAPKADLDVLVENIARVYTSRRELLRAIEAEVEN